MGPTGRIFRSSVTVPSDTSPGTTLTMDSAYGYSTAHGWSGLLSVTGESTTVFDCTTVSPDASKVGPGLLASQTYASVVGGYASVFEAYLRVSSTSQNATWLVAEGAITAEADALTGVRFNSSGVVEFLDDGVWSADSAFNYSEDTWYRVRFETEDLTAPVNPYTAVYQGYIAPCGSTFTKVRADAVIGDGTRLLQGMEEWTIGSADVSQTIEIKHNDWVIGNCIPTQCAWESGWGGGSGAPDGCGDTLPGCGGP